MYKVSTFRLKLSSLNLAAVFLIAGDSVRLITASADQTAILWDVQSGRELFKKPFEGPARYSQFSFGGREVIITTDPFMGSEPAIQVCRINDDRDESTYPYKLTYNFC